MGNNGNESNLYDSWRRGGARHFIEQFGPALKWPWTHPKAPLTKKIIDRFVEGTEAQAEGKSIRELKT